MPCAKRKPPYPVEKGKKKTFLEASRALEGGDLAPRPEKSAAQMKQRLGKALEQALLAQTSKVDAGESKEADGDR